MSMEGKEHHGELRLSSMVTRKMRRVADLFDGCSIPNKGIAENGSQAPSNPSVQEFGDAASADRVALTGSAALGKVGQTVGPMDIGECEDSYMFRVSLPGVKRNESEFSCEVSDDGKVSIRGVTTTGEKAVNRFSQKFEMLSRNLCPPGHFSISFQLPGPVNPREFTGSFRTDGIFEGIVMKKREKVGDTAGFTIGSSSSKLDESCFYSEVANRVTDEQARRRATTQLLCSLELIPTFQTPSLEWSWRYRHPNPIYKSW